VDTVEPHRTERLLRRPLALWRSRPGDAHNTLALLWLSDVSSHVGIYYQITIVCHQAAISLLVGLSAAAASSSSPVAHGQVCAVIAVQVMLAAYCFIASAAADKLKGAVAGTSYALETAAVSMLYLAAFMPEYRERLAEWTFYPAFGAVAVQFFQLVYDLAIVPIGSALSTCGRDGCYATTIALLVALVVIPFQFASLFFGFGFGNVGNQSADIFVEAGALAGDGATEHVDRRRSSQEQSVARLEQGADTGGKPGDVAGVNQTHVRGE